MGCGSYYMTVLGVRKIPRQFRPRCCDLPQDGVQLAWWRRDVYHFLVGVVCPAVPPAFLRPPPSRGRCNSASQTCERVYAPSSLLMVFFPRFRISMASLIHRWYLLLSDVIILAPSQSIMWLFLLQWSDMADFRLLCCATCFCARVRRVAVSFSHSFLCSFLLVPKHLPVSPMYTLLHVLHVISYIMLHFLSCCILSLGCTSICLSFVSGFMAVVMLCLFMALCMRSVVPLMYGMVTLLCLLSSCVLVCLFSFFFCVLSLFACCFPLLMAHVGYWQRCSACSMCFSSLCLSSSSVMMWVRPYNVLTTDSLWREGGATQHYRWNT